MFEWLGLKKLLDKAIASQQIRPVILVVPNSKTKFGGSFYTNSKFIGNWSDFIAKDVVSYIDKNYRTIANSNNRGISGHSMGGNGALKIAMLHPDIFSMVYAMSPAVLDWADDFTIENPGFQRISESKTAPEIIENLANSEANEDYVAFYASVIQSMARAYATSTKVSDYKSIFPYLLKRSNSRLTIVF